MEFKLFNRYPNLVYGLSEKQDGSMRLLGLSDEEKDDNLKHRQNYFARFGIGLEQVVVAQGIHGTQVAAVDGEKKGSTINDTDGLITSTKDLYLALTVADCFPIFIFDPTKQVVAMLHCGWRGIAKNIVTDAVELLISEKFCKVSDVLVCVGPGIQKCHFEVKDDVLFYFEKYPETVIRVGEKIYIDLSGVVVEQLWKVGVKKEHIERSRECTYDAEDKYFSYRRDKPLPLQTMIAFIGVKS